MKIETVEHRGHEIHVYQDDDPESPRDWSNLGTMSCWHRSYNLGDEQPSESPVEFSEEHNDKNCIMLPLYLYDHSGITMNTSGFSCSWDSGQVGVIWVTLDDVRKEYSVKRISKKIREKVISILRQEVATYDQFITGQVYGYTVEGEHCDDSCWGFFGGTEYMITEAKSNIDWSLDQLRKSHLDKLKQWIKSKVNLNHRTALEVCYGGA